MPPVPKNASRVSGLHLKQAIENLSKILGRSIVDLLIYDLEKQGITFGHDESYNLESIGELFRLTFGKDGSSLLMDKLRKELEKEDK